MTPYNIEILTYTSCEANDEQETAAQRRPAPQLPPPPISFTRRQPSAGVCKPAAATKQQEQLNFPFIQAARRNLFQEILESDICTVENIDGEESLWAVVEDIFLQ